LRKEQEINLIDVEKKKDFYFKNVYRFQRRRFLKIGQSETRIACGGHAW
jgi:hypothetical protein